MQNNFITNLLDLKGVIVTKCRNRKNLIRIHKEKQSMKDVAKISNVSSTTVSALLPYLSTSASNLPEVLCIDEFRGNAGNYKYQVSLIDGKIGKPIDIVECRHKHYLFSYFNKFTLAERSKVKYVIMDLWQPYKDLAKHFFPNAKNCS